MRRTPKKPVVNVKVVPWGNGRWGMAGTLDKGRTHFAYPVGTKDAAVAAAVHLSLGSLEYNPTEGQGLL
jgi:hypothetical protein